MAEDSNPVPAIGLQPVPSFAAAPEMPAEGDAVVGSVKDAEVSPACRCPNNCP